MKQIAVLFIIILQVSLGRAQEISPGSLDSLSALISKYQARADGLPYKTREGGLQTLNFPKENFRIWSYNKLATNAILKTTGNKESLEITEDIDLSKALHLDFHHSYYHGSSQVYTYRIWFPENSLTTQVYENGKLARKDKRSYIDIIDVKGARNERSSADYHQAYLTLGYTINLMKKPGYDLQEFNDEFAALMDENKESEYLDFLEKYPQSIYTKSITSLLRPFDEVREKVKAEIRYIDDFMAKYKVRKDLTERNIFYEIPETAFLQQHKQGSCYYEKKLRKKDVPAVGPYSIHRVCYSVGSPDLASYSLIMFVSESQEEVLKERDKLIGAFRKNISDRYIHTDASGITVYNPKGYDKDLRISIRYETYTRHQTWHYYILTFSNFNKNQ